MKRILRVLLAIALIFSISFSSMPISSEAAFNDLRRHGVKVDLKKGNWTSFYTKLPGTSKYQKLYAKITKFSTGSKGGKGGGGGSSGGGNYKITIQIQIPSKINKKVAKHFMKRINNGKTVGNEFIDYVDICIVDFKTGENLKSVQTDGEKGLNYQEVVVQEENEWKKYKPQKAKIGSNTYSYYVSYAKTYSITVPTGYTDLCIGVCGTHISNYEKMTDWNLGFAEGYTNLSDTSHVKLRNKKLTGKLCHFFRITPTTTSK